MNKPDYPQDLNIQTFLMCAPFVSAFNNEKPNNALMKKGVVIDYNQAFQEWLKLYRYIALHGLVYVLPNEGWHQDQIYVANLGIVLHHLKKPTVIISNFKSPPRKSEWKEGVAFFEQMKYNVHLCPYYFEGEADCKYIKDDLYICGYGIRSDLRSYRWMSEKFQCDIIPIEMSDVKCYHFDCCFFPLDEQNALVNVGVLDDNSVRLIEKYINVIDVPKELKYTGITNLARIGSTILCRNLDPPGKKWLNKICTDHGYGIDYFPLNSQDANGADLSCCLMHINKPFRPTGSSIVASVKNFFRS